jgi:hypothetical protein
MVRCPNEEMRFTADLCTRWSLHRYSQTSQGAGRRIGIPSVDHYSNPRIERQGNIPGKSEDRKTNFRQCATTHHA